MSNANKIDLGNLRDEIDKRKNEGVRVLEENNVTKGNNKWLNDLVESTRTGNNTETLSKIHKIENKTDQIIAKKKGFELNEENSPNYMMHVNKEPKNESFRDNSSNNLKERDDKMFEDFSKMKYSNSTLSDSINDFNNNGSQNHRHNNVNENNNNSGVINEELLGTHMNQYLDKNITPLMEEMMKNTIIEIYSVDRVKKILKENPELLDDVIKENPKIVENIVINTIKKLQQRKKKT